MTDPQKIRLVTGIEERLIQAFEALSAVLDDEDALREVTVNCFDPADPDREQSIESRIKASNETVMWALAAARAKLLKLGAIVKR